jgi:hypothetical protein
LRKTKTKEGVTGGFSEVRLRDWNFWRDKESFED